MPAPISRTQLEELKQFDTPTVSNAIERFGLRPAAAGFVDHTVRCQFPQLGVMVGYAVTCTTAAARPPSGSQPTPEDYFDHVVSVPPPRVAVAQDLDRPAGVGAFIGEVNGTMHQTLGVVGHVTDGCSRDFDQLEAMGFHVFAAGPCVSHAHVHIVEVGVEVVIGGCAIRPGDLVHADRHGVCVVPEACAAELAEACRAVIASEREILDLCRSEEFSLDKLKALLARRRKGAH